MGFAAIGNFTEVKKLQLDAMNLAADISTVRLMAYSGKKLDNQIPKGGYGVLINAGEKRNYFVYADIDGDFKYDAGDQIVEQKSLSSNIRFSNQDGVDVCFRLRPAGGGCFFGADCGTVVDKYLTVQGEKTLKSRTLSINMQNGAVNIDSSGCPQPYNVMADNRCVRSCSAGTEPDARGLECVCKRGMVVTGYDHLGRRICEVP